MNNALPLFGLAAALSSCALIIWAIGRIVLKTKELERSEPQSTLSANSASAMAEVLSRIETRLERLEHAVDTTAIEVERLAEGQRYAARVLATGEKASDSRNR
jgi:hypothetical protein